jgi:hypothetical protein
VLLIPRRMDEDEVQSSGEGLFDIEVGGAEVAPLLLGDEASEGEISFSNKRNLYLSHFLSTWNSRFFEFGAILFLAGIFPGTLLPASVYALVRTASAIVLAPLIGRFIDNGDRLKVVRTSIGNQPSFLFK